MDTKTMKRILFIVAFIGILSLSIQSISPLLDSGKMMAIARERVGHYATRKARKGIPQGWPGRSVTTVPAKLMPDVLGKYQNDAETCLRNAGIEEWEIVDVQSGSGFGTVIRQEPQPGLNVSPEKGSVIIYIARSMEKTKAIHLQAMKKNISSPEKGSGLLFFILFGLFQILVLSFLLQIVKTLRGLPSKSSIIIMKKKL